MAAALLSKRGRWLATQANVLAERPFEFAVQAAPARHAGEWAALAREAEGLGYAALLVPDHIGSGGPLTALAVAGAATTTLRVGTLMLGVDFHNPVVVAQELVTLDALVGGRLELGLGAGWMRRDYDRSGVPMDPAGRRIERLREFATLVRQLWCGGPLDHDGRDYSACGAVTAPQPLRPEPTLVLGGGGRRMLALASELADIVSVSAAMTAGSSEAPLGESASHAAFVRRRRWIEDEVSRLGREPPVIQCLAFEAQVAPGTHGRACDVARGFGLDPEEVVHSPLTLLGTVPEICAKLECCRAELGISYWVVKSPAIRDFAAVVERLAGR